MTYYQQTNETKTYCYEFCLILGSFSRYSTNGNHFATVSSDGKAFLYEGKSGDLIKELGSPAHAGGIYACSWNADGTKLLTASGDKTAKIFDIETGSGLLRM